jgi:hypothetical protein
MAIEMPGLPPWTREAAADYRTKQYYFVEVDGNGRAALPTGDGAVCDGVLQNDPVQYEAATIYSYGISKVVSNGTVEAGDNVSCANGGKAKETASGEYIQGTALEGDGGVDGTIISVLLRPQGRLA